MNTYYNEIDPHASGWIRNLIAAGHVPPGTVDTTDIHHVSGDTVRHFRRCHFFAGIAGWELALQFAGWPVDRPVWTGSCPCQPYSSAGKGKGDDDPRNLWPEFFRIIRECRPECIFGEQVESAIGHGWLDGISADLEREGYAVGAAVLGAHSVGAPHIRQRLYWVAHTGHVGARGGHGRPDEYATPERMLSSADDPAGGMAGRMADAQIDRLDQQRRDAGSEADPGEPGRNKPVDGGCTIGVGDSPCERRIKEFSHNRWCDEGGREAGGEQRSWDSFSIIPCRDGKSRRFEPGSFPLAHGVSGRVGLLRGYGNAIVPQVAAEFVMAFLEATS